MTAPRLQAEIDALEESRVRRKDTIAAARLDPRHAATRVQALLAAAAAPRERLIPALTLQPEETPNTSAVASPEARSPVEELEAALVAGGEQKEEHVRRGAWARVALVHF